MATFKTISIGQIIGGIEVTSQNKNMLSNTLKNVVDMEQKYVIGKMGKRGAKVHAFLVNVFTYNGIAYLAGGHDLCGSSQYMSASMTDEISKVTCVKCLKAINK
jgi:hypothetical protein